MFIGPLFSPSTAAPSIHRLALTLVSAGACGFAGAGMLSASAAHQFAYLPEQAAAALLAVDARRSRPARSSTSLFDQLGDTSSTGTLQASSAQRAPRRAAALLEKMGCSSRGPWSAFPWSWRPPRSSKGKTKVVGLVELSMPAPLDTADTDGITSYYLALCDPPAGGPTYCRPLSGCRRPLPLADVTSDLGIQSSGRRAV